MRHVMRYLPFFALAVLNACGDSLGQQATFPNKVDTVTIYALTKTPVSTPSGYSMALSQVVRTDGALPFDFAFDIDSTGQAVLLPTGAMHLGRGSGIQISPHAFDSIHVAPTSRYQLDSAVVVDTNIVAIVQSRPVTCNSGLVGLISQYYAKLRVLEIDIDTTRSLRMEILNDQNCGFRGLDIGLPRN
jgi:hypothetical protein